VPYGYETVSNPDGPGLILAIDEEAADVIRGIFKRVVAGEAVHAIRDDLNSQGVLSPANYYRQRRGKPLRDEVWGSKTIFNLIRERTVLGQKVHDPNWREDGSNGLTRRGATGKAVRGADGNPIQQGPPLVSYAGWTKARKAVDDAARPQTKRHPLYVLAGVLRCMSCKYPMSAQTNDTDAKPRRYYRCSAYARGRTCDAKLVRAEGVEAAFEDSFLSRCGNREVEDLIWQEGQDHSDRIAEIEETLTELAEDRRMGLYRGEEGSARFRAMYSSLEEERARLLELPVQLSGYVRCGTGMTYRHRWMSGEAEARNALLIEHQIHGEVRRLGAGPGFELEIYVGGEDRVTA
jgi:hypothetical protein